MTLEPPAGNRSANQRQFGRGGSDIGRAHGIAVHGRGGEGRLRAGGGDVAGQNPPRSLADGDRFGIERRGSVQYLFQRRLDGKKPGHQRASRR
jgi:hypothetical protein